jgi:uncharacterized protein with LGFP repeats
MREITKRTAAISIAIAGFGLLGAGCDNKDSSTSTGGTSSSTSASATSSSAASSATTTTSAAPTTQMTGANGTAYAVSGPILDKYNTLDDKAKASLKAPIHEQVTNTDGGVFQQFDGGVIISSKAGTFVVWGKIRDAWNALGGSQGKLGYPTTDEVTTPDGDKQTSFEHGKLTWKPGAAEATVSYS